MNTKPRLLCMMDLALVPESLARLRAVAEVDCVPPDRELLSAFGADVLHGEGREPMVDSPVVRYAQDHENVVLTPHMGGGTHFPIVEARRFMADRIAGWFEQKSW